MHKFILQLYDAIRNLIDFLKILCVLFAIFLLLYWIEHLTHGYWGWLDFIKPHLDGLISFSKGINSSSFDFFGALFEMQYFIALVVIALTYGFLNLVKEFSYALEGMYKNAYFIYRKTEELKMNQILKKEITEEETRIKRYSLTVHTKIKSKYRHRELNIDLEEQNKILLKFLAKKLGQNPEKFGDGYIYYFDNFNQIDRVLEVFFKVLKSETPITCAICIQAGENEEQLQKLISLKHYGKITMVSDTAYRYRYNKQHWFNTIQIGLFQNGNKTIEVYQFEEYS